RVPPVEQKYARVECVCVAMPIALPLSPVRASLDEGRERGRSDERIAERPGRCEQSEATDLPLSSERAAALERVRLYVQVKGADECWPLKWPDGMKGADEDGYPRIKVGGRYVPTYKLVYEETNGEQGDDESVDRVCHTWDSGCQGGRESRHRWCH